MTCDGCLWWLLRRDTVSEHVVSLCAYDYAGVKPRRSYARRNGQQQSQQAGTDQQPTVPVVLTEAGMVRSGGATVNRPRRVVQQRLNEPAEGEAAALVDVVEPAMAGSAATANDGDVVAVDQPAAAAPREGAAPDSPRRRSRR